MPVLDAQFDATLGQQVPSTTATDPVKAVTEILSGADGYGLWTPTQAPQVKRLNDYSQKQRERENDPTLYVWSPVEGTLDAFDAKFTRMDESNTVEVSAWTLDRADTAQYSSDVIQIASEYATDNEANTAFHQIRPTNENDLRSEHIRRKTDHFVTNVTIEVTGLRPSGT